jgi:hypothetical protein
MRKVINLAILITLVSFTSSAQNTGNITGTVKDDEGKALQSATVSLLKAQDSSLVKVAVSDKVGKYEFVSIKEGKYLLSYTSVGFEKKFSNHFDLSGATIEMPATALVAAAKGLSGVTVQSKKPFIETKLDKTIVNVEASPTNAGSTALVFQ